MRMFLKAIIAVILLQAILLHSVYSQEKKKPGTWVQTKIEKHMFGATLLFFNVHEDDGIDSIVISYKRFSRKTIYTIFGMHYACPTDQEVKVDDPGYPMAKIWVEIWDCKKRGHKIYLTKPENTEYEGGKNFSSRKIYSDNNTVRKYAVKNTSKYSIELMGGYNFGVGKSLLGTNNIQTESFSSGGYTYSQTYEGVYGSWGQGVNAGLSINRQCNPHLGFGVYVDYINGKKFSWMESSTSYNNGVLESSDVNNYEGRLTTFWVSPYVRLQGGYGGGKLVPFVQMGAQFNIGNSIKQTETSTGTSSGSSTNTSEFDGTLKGKLGIGFNGAIGLTYKLSNNWGLTGGVYGSNSHFMPDKFTVTKYSVNGVDKLSTLTLSEKETDYVKSVTTNGQPQDPNKPTQQVAAPQAEGTIGFKIGLYYNIGGKNIGGK